MIIAVRITASAEVGTPAIEDRAAVLTDRYRLRLRAQEAPIARVTNERGFERVLGVYRVGPGEASAALEDIKASLADRAWARVDSHQCTHDAPEPGPCQPWQTVYQHGDVPEEAQ